MDGFPKTMEVKIRHRFEGRTRILALVFMASLTTASVSTGLWYGSWRENARLRPGDLKYRYQSLTQPQSTLHTDTVYSRDPAGFRRMVEQLEAGEKALARAEALAREKETEAQKAKQKVEQLKRRNR